MEYVEALEHLYGLGPELAPARTSAASPGLPPRKFDLAHMRRLCEALGDPQREVPAILIAGTNGKGSTAATLASIFAAAGYRTGLYTSPHLVKVNERIQLTHGVLPSEYAAHEVHAAEGRLRLSMIADDDFARLYSRVDDASTALVGSGALPWMPSFFERLTAVAFLYFAEAKAEVIVLEVGLGGRLDATNVVEPILSVITDIALDHQEYLGNTITEIAGEKCGILRKGGLLVTLPQHPEANTAIGVAATALGVDAVNAAIYMPPAERNGAGTQQAESMWLARNRYQVRLDDGDAPELIEVDSPLAGSHQQRNLALAIASAITLRNRYRHNQGLKRNGIGYDLSNGAIEAGIRCTVWPGRLEMVRPNLLLDVAHNPAGAWTLRNALSSMPPAMPRTLVFSCLRDKSLNEMSRILFPLFDSSGTDPLRARDHVVLVPLASARATPVEELSAAAEAMGVPAHAAPHVRAALAQARAVTPAGGLIVATGSVYLVGEVRSLVLEGDAWS